MKQLFLIGIGAGNPEYITIQAIKALNQVDVFFVMDKGDAKGGLNALRKDICERYIEPHRPYRIVEAADPVRDPAIPDYTTRVEHWHQQRVLLYEHMIQHELADHQTGAFLVWGDPSLYDSTLRILDRMQARALVSFTCEVIPGITSIQALAARHRIPLNGIGESVLITTGRQLASGLSGAHEKIVVMLDGQSSFHTLPDQTLDIFWGAYLGMDDEILLSGTLAEVAPLIDAARTRARQKNGWIMDTYLLSKPTQNDPPA